MVELTTQLLILKNILWLPLCRINKFGLYFTLESCCDPLHLWVISEAHDGVVELARVRTARPRLQLLAVEGVAVEVAVDADVGVSAPA